MKDPDKWFEETPQDGVKILGQIALIIIVGITLYFVILWMWAEVDHNEGKGTFLGALIGLGGIAAVAWYNSLSDRRTRQAERDANVKENADQLYIALSELLSAYCWAINELNQIRFQHEQTHIEKLEKLKRHLTGHLSFPGFALERLITDSSISRGLGEEIIFRLNEIFKVDYLMIGIEDRIQLIEEDDEFVVFTIDDEIQKLASDIKRQAQKIDTILDKLKSRFGYNELPGFVEGVSHKLLIDGRGTAPTKHIIY